ncbi:MAG TPA: TfoX/Sxy family protein [Anaeromyxobacteraceae bacterium]|nr:TfoX/Sxy family protein [Anaeromyxobacteraceae bacterium]
MSRQREFEDHCLDLFSPLGPVLPRRMFGGVGFYLGGAMFAIGDPDEWRLWLKVDGGTRPAFEAAGGEPFVYLGRGKREVSLSYWAPPPEAMDGAEGMLPWGRLAVEAARRARVERLARAKERARRGAGASARTTRATGRAAPPGREKRGGRAGPGSGSRGR